MKCNLKNTLNFFSDIIYKKININEMNCHLKNVKLSINDRLDSGAFLDYAKFKQNEIFGIKVGYPKIGINVRKYIISKVT